MPNLEEKFEALEAQLATQHTAIGNAIDALLTALGVPPPTATVTLGDTVALMNAMNNNLIGIAVANGSYHTSVLALLETIAVNTDTIITNNSLNAQRMFALLLATACPCDDVALLPPTLTTLPTSDADIAKCARIQYFIDLFFTWYIEVSVYLQRNAISGWQVDNLLAIQMFDVGITTGQLTSPIPVSVRDSIASQISAAIIATPGATPADTFSLALLDAHSEITKTAMQQALYSATNASDGSIALYAAIDALELPSAVAGILKTMFYSAWPNDIYGAVPVVDTTGYDGEICAPAVEAECFSAVAEQITIAGNLRWVVLLSSDHVGWSVRVESGGVGVSLFGDGDPGRTISTGLYTLTSDNINTGRGEFWFSREFGGAYTLRFCPPGIVE